MDINYEIRNGVLTIKPEGDFFACDCSLESLKLAQLLKNEAVKKIEINTERLGRWDSTLLGVLFEASREGLSQKLKVEFVPGGSRVEQMLALALSSENQPTLPERKVLPWLDKVGEWGIGTLEATRRGLAFIGKVGRSFCRWLTGKAVMRSVDFWFSLGDSSYKAVAIVSLVSFMVGLILAFVGAIQLRTFGASIYVTSLVAIAMTRIMGAIMAGIIMAGRTGASYAATIGTMQVNEEIDALKTMGISTTDFLVLPRIGSLMLAMPFLTMLADLMGIIGGAMVGIFMLDISWQEYWKYTESALKMGNFMVGVFHGWLYGFIIGVCGCYYGIKSGRNAGSVGEAATKAVVSAIVWMIVATGILTWLFEVLGI